MLCRLVTNSILHNIRQQTVTNDNKREKVRPTKHSSMHSIVPYITYNYRDAKCRSVSRSAPRLEKPKTL